MKETTKDRTDIDKLQATLARYSLALTESRWDAEDLAQEAWLKALESKTVTEHANPEAYMLRVARNAWTDTKRRRATLQRVMRPLSAIMQTVEPADESFLQTEEAFHAVMLRLPRLQRAVFMLRDVYGYSASETADRLGITEGAVKAALHRARRTLPEVKAMLVQGKLAMPKDEDLKAVLRVLASAYRSGDIESTLSLVQYDALEPTLAIGMLQSRRLRAIASPAKRNASSTTMAMAA
ncbi:sigma-70 family RNA polymerase sigma factor [Cohnella yongneupensis]|uniref:Sigma-70 family RNA polymerase sigma factor n=1 Tax=Cohnella yongneupensis TaxID=425006 RepID=A0ABW0QYL9_9BACL